MLNVTYKGRYQLTKFYVSLCVGLNWEWNKFFFNYLHRKPCFRYINYQILQLNVEYKRYNYKIRGFYNVEFVTFAFFKVLRYI